MQKSAQHKTSYLQEVSALQKSTMSINRASGDSERWSGNWRKLHDTRGELAHVHQVQSAAQTVIGELHTCPSASYIWLCFLDSGVPLVCPESHVTWPMCLQYTLVTT